MIADPAAAVFTIKDVADVCGFPEPVIAQLVPRSWIGDGWMYTQGQLQSAVAGGGDVERYQVFDLLTLLVDKSLVVAENTGGRTRYRLLQTVRQYGAEAAHRDFRDQVGFRRQQPLQPLLQTLLRHVTEGVPRRPRPG